MARADAAFGLDIGGSGIKGAPVNLVRGALAADRMRIETPHPATPHAVSQVVTEIVGHFDATGPVGVTFPAVVVDGVARTAANVDKAWIGTDVAASIRDAGGGEVVVLNDADAAGLAEARYGAGRDVKGTLLVVTLGTGIGSALFVGGELVPNTELGHLEVRGKEAEKRAAESVRERKDLSWKKWAKRVGEYLAEVEDLLWPERIVIGGGVSKKSDKFLGLIEGVRTPVVPAQLLNEAGIIGAALRAAELA